MHVEHVGRATLIFAQGARCRCLSVSADLALLPKGAPAPGRMMIEMCEQRLVELRHTNAVLEKIASAAEKRSSG
ncbi:hypothetical protein [Bradyrhizobium sp. CB1015]|uniref:hypothetical protein n=1 Tax=Bradyrhizobium sp. CB1015 TaxID=2976822 RepID=UPI0021A9C616|nr:hypothetical protein [Bradyrhizobium sp. CB1015]UWU94134.1 hypothetical protein N2604_09855 [Bradyrhizobium sp. CB1015]